MSATNQLQSRIKAFVEQLAAQTEEAKSNTELMAYLKFAAAFREYSLHNTMLIFSQRPDASRVCGYKTWQKLGRQVRKGSKAIWILAPIISRIRSEDDEHADKIVARFRSVPVFDIADTEGEPLPEAPVLTHGASCSDDLIRAAVFFADAEGIAVQFGSLGGGAYGLSRGGQVVVDETLQGADQFAVLVHELAHELLHHGNGERLDKQTREIEAETTAYVVCQHFAIASTAPAYLALYGADPKEITFRLSRLVSVIQRLVGGIETNLTQLTHQAVNS